MTKHLLSVLAVCVVFVSGIGLIVFFFGVEEKATYTIRLADFHTMGSGEYDMAKRFKQRLEEKTNGQIEVKLFLSGQLGGTRETLESIRLGIIQMTFAFPGVFADYVPEYSAMGLPFLFDDYGHVERMMDSPALAELGDKMANKMGLRVLGWIHSGFRFFFGNTEIRQLSDFAGLKFRSPEAEVFVETMKSLKIVPVPLPWVEVYTALKTGLTDGAETTADGFYANKLWDVSKYVIQTHHMNTIDGLVISERFYQSLPRHLQEAVVETTRELEPIIRKQFIDAEAGKMEEAKNNGIEFIDIDIEPLRVACTRVRDVFQNKYPGIKELVAEAERLRISPLQQK